MTEVAQHWLHLTAFGVGMLRHFAKSRATMILESRSPGGRSVIPLGGTHHLSFTRVGPVT